jgi:hypothetical protein
MRAQGASAPAKNKANLGRRAPGGRLSKQTQSRLRRAGRGPRDGRRGGQFCKTKPICAGLAVGHGAPPSPLAPAVIVRNEAKFGCSCGIWGGGDAERGPDAPNKPNSRWDRLGQGLGHEGRLCETNPICSRREESVGQAPPYADSIAPNKANRAAQPIVRNKANFGERTGRGRLCDIASMPRFGQQSQTWAGWDIWGDGAWAVPVMQSYAPARDTPVSRFPVR